jgi:F-type H+-transporting ATPase subunit epsilon
VAGGFAEVNEERITVLAEEAIPVSDITADMAAARAKSAKEALSDAKSERERVKAERLVLIAEAMEEARH